MEHRSKPSFWDRDGLLQTVKETYQQLHGECPKSDLYDDTEIKALEAENGAGGETRTPNRPITNRVLYQLSHASNGSLLSEFGAGSIPSPEENG